MREYRFITFLLAGLMAIGVGAETMEVLEVVAPTPLRGASVDPDKLPYAIQSVTDEEIRAMHSRDLTDFMQRSLQSVFVNEAQSNPLQPDVQFRGFVGSPLLGLAQGISVYQDGVRINEPFGDTINWAIIPTSAIASLNLVPGSNPLYGLNTLGGAVSIRTKTGLTHPGTRGEIYGGSFERYSLQAETGGAMGDRQSYFVSGWYFEEDGWRDFSPSEATQLFGNYGWHLEASGIDLSLSYAETDLIGNGPAPIQLLELDREAIFTHPDITENQLMMLSLSGEHAFNSWLNLDGTAYFRSSDIDTLNGDDADFEACEDDPDFLCESEDGDEEIVIDDQGEPVPFSEDLEGAVVNRTRTEQTGYGISVQLASNRDLAGWANQLIAGASVDIGDVEFASSTELGTLDDARRAVPGGVLVGDALTAVDSKTTNIGVYFTDTLSVTPDLAVTVSGRYNRSEVELRDQLGTALNGDHDFDRFNPAAGISYVVLDALNLYLGYSEANRVPSPIELTCADEADPCRLPNAFLSDPPLDQVVAKSWEAGIRGQWRDTNWHLGMFRTDNQDDIIFISAGALTNQGFFDNVGDTRRQGIEISADGVAFAAMTWSLSYTFLEATFEENFTVSSPNNPAAIDGEIEVRPGDRLPLTPEHQLKAAVSWQLSPQVSLGADLVYVSDQVYRGDEGNDVDPIDDYTVVNARADYTLNDNWSVFIRVDNIFDADYETFGLFGSPDEVLGEEFDDSRFLSPGAPIGAWVGIRARFE